MHTTAGQFKSDLIDEVAGLASARLEGDQVDDVQRFVREFYRNVSPGDVLGTPPEDLYAAALSLWNATRTRPAGHPMIRALNPSFEVHGWSSRHSVVEVATDDTPFLVDSVMAELNRRELMVHRLIHPVLPVRRDDAGRRSGLAAAGDPDARLESYQQIVVNRQTNEELEAIVEGLRSVLADVRSAIEDWPAMRERVDDGLRDLSAAPPPISGVDLAEVREFLRWLQEGHFTFLGYREYRLVTSGGQRTGQVVPGSGLGVLRDDAFVIFRGMKGRGTLGSTDGTRRSETRALMILKANCRATVHRSSFMDAVSLLRLDAKGKIAGEHLYLGLFTSSFYLRSPWDVPVVRGKVQNCVERAGLDPVSHDGKALRHILETYPRDELLQATPDELHEAALAILRLQERQRVMLFVRRDPHGRFASCLVYVPRDRYDTAIRQRFQAILERAYGGPVVDFTTQLGGDSQLARVHFVVRTAENDVLEVDVQAVEQQLVDAARAWPDRLRRTLVDHFGEARGLDLFRNYRAAFPTSYREQVPPHGAIRDVEMVEATRASNTFGMNLYRPIESGPREVHFRICSPTGAVPLSDVLPMMEHMGLRVLSEQPARLDLPAADVWLHDFTMVAPVDLEAGFETLRANFHDGFRHLHSGDVEADGFNRLILIAGLTWREVTILRAYSRYLRQVAIPFSGAYMAETLAKNAGLTRLLVELFHARFDPAAEDDREGNERRLVQRIERGLDQVEILDEDRIVRRFLNLTRSTLRTNYYQTDAAGQPKPYLSFKLDCRAVEGLPLPRPMVEIFVYSARMEGVHLRGGRVARGGIRWSDRREDFRTEVLGLMKAQMVKNAVIVPVGSKGGFVVKRPPAEAGRSALMAEVVHCYSTLMRGMLDLTDNLRGEDVVPPPRVLRRDGDDPYLVVAADKGTATFSDIANGIAAEYGFWLGDAFASGGSAGYDHKRMGITARGAWESVTRHFREMGHDLATTPFTVIGVGDMSGDVFGNGMLLSRQIKLVAAFNHLHVFVDPAPDPETSFLERERLFQTAGSSWSDYDPSRISPGGGVFDRRQKSVHTTPEIRAMLGLEAEYVTPNDLIWAILRAPADLLWLGGIGTFVKATDETHAEVGDRLNDALRVDASELRCRVVGEGANLGLTQRARVEVALAGVRLNTDAVDNSAGVDCSDHEVNIKILLRDIVAAGGMTGHQRNQILEEMTDEVAQLVLRDNYLQTLAISADAFRGAGLLDSHHRLILALERSGRLDRSLERLPSDQEIARRQAAGIGLTRPELAVLLAYSKIALYQDILASDLPDSPLFEGDLIRYFPAPIRHQHASWVVRHRLRRELVSTILTNALVNRAGSTFVSELAEKTGRSAADVARAFAIARDVFDLEDVWSEIEALETQIRPEVQIRMLECAIGLLQTVCQWFLRSSDCADIAARVAEYGPGVRTLASALPRLMPRGHHTPAAELVAELVESGVGAALARRVARLSELANACDIVQIAAASDAPVELVGRVFFAVGSRFGLNDLLIASRTVAAKTAWQKRALAALADDLGRVQRALAISVLANGRDADEPLEAWTAHHPEAVERVDAVLQDVRSAGGVDLAILTVAVRELQSLVLG